MQLIKAGSTFMKSTATPIAWTGSLQSQWRNNRPTDPATQGGGREGLGTIVPTLNIFFTG